MQTYSTQEELRDALHALPIHQLVARLTYYQLIEGVTYQPNPKKRNGNSDNVISVEIPGYPDGIGITGPLFTQARERALARIRAEQKRDRISNDALKNIAYNARKYRVATPAINVVLRIADAIDGEIIAHGDAIRNELATINGISRGGTEPPATRTRAERNTPTLQTAGRRATGAAPALAR